MFYIVEHGGHAVPRSSLFAPRFVSSLPRAQRAILHLLLPRAERAELLADIDAEYRDRVRREGGGRARRWAWRQALGSAPALLRWAWWRGWSGFEPRANAYRPGDSLMQHLMSDLRYAMRRLRARPSYTILAVLTLALGIGGTAAAFGIARPLVLDPLPYANGNRIAAFWKPGWWTEEEYLYLRDKFDGFGAVAAYRPSDLILHEDNAPTRLLTGVGASAELFDVLGANAALGRTFRVGDDRQGAEPVVVISHGLWRELGGDVSIIGRRLMLDGAPRTVVGVMPRSFWFPDPSVRIWYATPLDPMGRNGSYAFLGLVPPDKSISAMAPHVARLAKIIGQRFSYSRDADKSQDAFVRPLRDELLGKMHPTIVATLSAMSLILLIACANVAALMLGQVEGRATELAVRSALGANRGRIMQQLVIEAVILGLLAAAIGGALAGAGFRLFAQALPIGAWADSVAFNWTVFASALAIALAAALLIVLVPLVSLRRADLRGALNGARSAGIQGRGGRLERGLVVAEVALAMMIASGTAVLLRSVANLYHINPGIDTKGVGVVDIVSTRGMNGNARVRTINAAVAAVAELPAVRSAAAAMKIPLRGGGDNFGLRREGQPNDETHSWIAYFRIVSPEYFATVGIPVREGHTFTAADLIPPRDTSRRDMPVVVNETLVKKYFAGENPVGKRMFGGFGIPQRIIGIVPDVAEAGLTDEAKPTVYYPHAIAWFGYAGSIVLRAEHPEEVVPLLEQARHTIQRVAPELTVQGTTTMDHVFDVAVGPARQVVSLLALLSGLALVLGAIGIYGVMAHFATRRKRDWAIRVALGLPGSRVITYIVRQGVLLGVFGIVIGALGAFALRKILSSFVYGVRSWDPVAYGTASVLLVAIGVVATLVPARRAGSVDPARVLREQ